VPLTAAQVAQLLQPIRPERVLTANNQSHVAQQDVTAHLTRIFGFEGWDKTILDLRCVRDEQVDVRKKPSDPPRIVPAVTYVCQLRLTVRDPDGNTVKVIEDVGTGTSPNLPSHGDAHDFAAKNAVSYALKRCAKDLGDQFGLSLYNKGQRTALVKDTLVRRNGQDASVADVQDGVEQQVSLGDTDGSHPADSQPSGPSGQGEADELRTEIKRFVADRKWDARKVVAAFVTEHKTPFDRASTDQLGTFLQFLYADAAAEDSQVAS
jgi:hypothetical protein